MERVNKFFYLKLAISNIKKNSKIYIPYIITCVCSIMMFYIMCSISFNETLNTLNGGDPHSMKYGMLKVLLRFGVTIIGIFSAIFIFYTNSFLIKRRKKEIGLFNVLGLGKKHIARVLFWEKILIILISLGFGIALGIVLDKLMFLFLLKILQFEVKLGFYISGMTIIITLVLFIAIFFLTLISDLIQVKISNPIELLKGGEQGEKEPKTKWIMTIIGVLSLSSGYILSVSIEDPLTAMNIFFVAVVLVMVGTYALFTAGSITFLKMLRKNKKFYYKTKNFVSVSGMIYRMKQNAVGLANICILSTAVLVTLSTTVSAFIGMEDALRTRYPREIMLDVYSNQKNIEIDTKKSNEILYEQIKKHNINIENKSNYWNKTVSFKEEGDDLLNSEFYYSIGFVEIVFIPLSDYNRLTGENIKLLENEVLFYALNGENQRDTIKLDGKTYNIKGKVNKDKIIVKDYVETMKKNIIVINDIDSIQGVGAKLYSTYFDIDNTDEQAEKFVTELNEKLENAGITAMIEDVGQNREDFLFIYGGLFFIGLFLGSLFLMATVLIIYYKQISEGYDDRQRFEIMQKVGMSKTEIRKTIRSQILMVFFIPLICTIIHLAFAFPMISKILLLMNLANTDLFIKATIGTVLIFTVIYGIVFTLTARVYYKIVE